ncbi:MAG: hypothetical protein K6C30_01375 [Bacteroidaceae bacterium]|nr:hypothetical protein [Bacteroidaceae bacterium]
MIQRNPDYKKNVKRRSARRDYDEPGLYHITIRVTKDCGQPFGHIAGEPMAPADSPAAPHMELSPAGKMIEYELLHSITARYPMLQVQDYVIMPDHLHFILEVREKIISRYGTSQQLGQVVAGFKKGCDSRYWELVGQATASPQQASPSPASPQIPSASPVSPQAPSPASPSSFRSPKRRFSSGRASLFERGNSDVFPLPAGQLATQRAYIKDNPRSRLLRVTSPWLRVLRGDVATALYPSALRGFLKRECSAAASTDEQLAAIEQQLLLAPDGTITCDTYGDRQLLSQHLLPVVCHRKDAHRFLQQKTRCLEAARQGTVLISARIAKGEQEIMDAAIAAGYPVILIHNNGFGKHYHPYLERMMLCARHRLLLITPWRYHYKPADASLQPATCKTLNCLAQALSRQKDSWW